MAYINRDGVLGPDSYFKMVAGLGEALMAPIQQGRQNALKDRALALEERKVAAEEAAPGLMGNWLEAASGGDGGTGGTGGTAPAGAPGVQGAKAPTFAGGGGSMRMPADPEVEKKFIGTLAANGLTNPNALAAVAAYGSRESGYSAKNVTGSWSDPSERGAPGTSGGVLSWRGDRFENMRRQTAGAPDPVEAQAKFFLTENPQLTQALQGAKSPEEAHTLMANAWRFAGYNRPGGENAERLNATRSYLGKVAGAAGVPVAEAAPQAPAVAAAPAFASPQGFQLSAAPAAGVQVASADPSFAPAAPAAAAPAALSAPSAPSAPSAMGGLGRLNARQVSSLKAMYANPTTRPYAMQVMAKFLEPKDVWRDEHDAQGRLVGQRNAVTNQFQAAAKGEADPAAVREFQALQRMSPEDRKAFLDLKRAGGTNVNVGGGGSDKQIFDEISDRTKVAKAAAAGMVSIGEARKAATSGTIFGAGAGAQLQLQKVAKFFGVTDGKAIQDAETFRSAIAPQVAATMKATVGSANISNTDREWALEAAGGSIALDKDSILRLLDIQERASAELLEQHNREVDDVYPEADGHKRERALFRVRYARPVRPEAGAGDTSDAPTAPAPGVTPPAAPIAPPASVDVGTDPVLSELSGMVQGAGKTPPAPTAPAGYKPPAASKTLLKGIDRAPLPKGVTPAQAIESARARLAKNPALREEIEGRLRAHGIDPTGKL